MKAAGCGTHPVKHWESAGGETPVMRFIFSRKWKKKRRLKSPNTYFFKENLKKKKNRGEI